MAPGCIEDAEAQERTTGLMYICLTYPLKLLITQGTDKYLRLYLSRVLFSKETAHLRKTYVDGLTRGKRT